MAVKIGCFRTEKDAIRIIRAGGFRWVTLPSSYHISALLSNINCSINMVKTDNTEEVVTHGKHIMMNGLTVVRVGKMNYYIVEWT